MRGGAHTGMMLRRAVLRHCGLDEISASISPISPISSISAPISGARSRAAPLRAVLLLRGDTQQDASLNQTDGDERRAFASPGAVRDELLSALPPGATLHTFVTAGDAPLCEQVQWVHGASVVLSPHGAHLTNALWMARGALLLEVMPWGMWDYPRTYTGLLKGAGVLHERLLSLRPPDGAP